jgi:ribose-phosphate pyrophosphokinase
MGVEKASYSENGETIRNEVVFIAGSGNIALAKGISDQLGIPVDFPVSHFPEGEVYAQLSDGLRRKHAVIMQSFSPEKINDQIMELLVIIDAAKRASAQEITALLPYYPYGRQDRKDKSRVPITAALIANTLKTAGANRIVTLSLHAEQVMGCFDGPWDNLYASYALVPEIRSICQDLAINNIANEVALFSPDTGGVKRADFYARLLGCELGVVPKIRDAHTATTKQLNLMTNFPLNNIKAAFIIDDLIAGGGTTCIAGEILSAQNIPHVYAVAEHALFLNNALSNIENSPLDKIITTDTVAHGLDVKESDKIAIVSVAELLAKAITYIHTGKSLGENLIL